MLSIRGKSVLRVAPGLPAEGGDIEANRAIEDRGQLLRELRTLTQPLLLRQLAEVEIFRGPSVVPRVASFEEEKHGTLRRVAI